MINVLYRLRGSGPKCPIINQQKLTVGMLRANSLLSISFPSTALISSANSISLCFPAETSAHIPYFRGYSSSSRSLEDNSISEAKDVSLDLTKLSQKRAAQKFNLDRSSYKKSVSQVRKQYAVEVASQREADQAKLSAERATATRNRLERQRLKNIRSTKNAELQNEGRQRRAEQFERELEVAQENRESRRERFEKARRLVLQELEEEAPLWFTTRKEVDKVLDSVPGQQSLWTRPGGYIGAPNPTDDAEFWRFESHTWDMAKTYSTPRTMLLEKLEDMAYNETNIDKNYWTKERVQEQDSIKEKAKLRALVREEGRKVLLMKQRSLLQDRHADSQKKGGIDGTPAISRPPPPSLGILGNYGAMEREGVKVLKADPTKFFKFDMGAQIDGHNTDRQSDGSTQTYDGQSLGKPIGLHDPIRDNSPTGSPYPELVGRLPRQDTRTQKEKKRDEREDRMWAAARAEAAAGVEFAAEEGLDTGSDPVDYDEIGNQGDEDDIEWSKGLDPVKDADLLKTPREMRYSEDDIEWVLSKLEEKIQHIKEVVKFEEESESGMASAKQGDIERTVVDTKNDLQHNEIINALGTEAVKSVASDDKGRTYTEYEVLGNTMDTSKDAESADVSLNKMIDDDDFESILGILSEKQLAALALLEENDDLTSTNDMREALGKVPGLSNDQIQSLIDLESSLSKNKNLRQKLGIKEEIDSE